MHTIFPVWRAYSDDFKIKLLPCNYNVDFCAHYTAINDKWFVLMPKCGCMTITYSNAVKKGVANKGDPFSWYKFNSEGISIRSILKETEGKKFVVFYRDPIERFVSFLNWLCRLGYYPPYTDILDEFPRPINQVYPELINNFIHYATYNNSVYDIANSDPHVVSQTRFLHYLLDPSGKENFTDNLLVYDLKDLNKVLAAEGVKPYTGNVSEKIYKISDLNKAQIAQLDFLYHEDYELAKRVITVS